MSRWPWSGLEAWLTVPVLVCMALPCAAHHTPAHAGSEGVRAMNALTQRSSRAEQQLMLLEEVSRPSGEPGGVPSTKYVTSLVGSALVHPWLAVGAQLPWVVVDETGGERRHGYGDTTLEAVLTPHGARLRHRVPTFGMRLSLPTRTFELTQDPGDVYAASLFAAFTRSYAQLYWQLMLLTSADTRPAGVAFEAGAGASLGYRSDFGLGGSLGSWVDTRLFAYCAAVDGTYAYCEQGRATERDRDTGATRAYALGYLSYDLSPFAFSAGLQLPFTPRRDFDWGVFAGVAFVF